MDAPPENDRPRRAHSTPPPLLRHCRAVRMGRQSVSRRGLLTASANHGDRPNTHRRLPIRFSSLANEQVRYAVGHKVTDAIRTIGNGLAGGNAYDPGSGLPTTAGCAAESDLADHETPGRRLRRIPGAALAVKNGPRVNAPDRGGNPSVEHQPDCTSRLRAAAEPARYLVA